MLITFFINYFIFNYLYLLKKVNQKKNCGVTLGILQEIAGWFRRG